MNFDDYGLKYVDDNGVGWKCKDFFVKYPPQHQEKQPGLEYIMNPLPIFDNPLYKSCGKLYGKIAIITGEDSGIGRDVASGIFWTPLQPACWETNKIPRFTNEKKRGNI